MNLPPKNYRAFESSVHVMQTLRSPNGCPWDKEQTHQSLTKHNIEETFELVEAVENGNDDDLKEELGDVLLQVLFHSEIARGEKRFDIYDVIEALNEKLVTRHPHVFGDVEADSSEEALATWTAQKDKEKSNRTDEFFHIPVDLPSLARSQKMGSKAKKRKFDWPNVEDVLKKVEEEIQELRTELKNNPDNINRIQDEMGDLLFASAQVARHLKVDAEKALREANRKFESRFFKMLNLVKEKDIDFDSLSIIDMESLWQEAKKL